jgi:hypothetical protein
MSDARELWHAIVVPGRWPRRSAAASKVMPRKIVARGTDTD